MKDIENKIDENSVVIIDSKVAKNFRNLHSKNSIILETNEDLKTWNGLETILKQLIDKKANVKTKLIVVGGGVLQDAAGFCASVFCRGIEYLLVPTTLLSQIDSCVGGKTSINYGSRKNILGTFYPPSEILICEDFLYTLTREDFCSGLGELFKFDLLRDQINISSINSILSNQKSVIKDIYESLKYKVHFLEIDEFDKKERKFLNFGHTFGHALEITSQYKLSHGYAVVIGCLIALRISKHFYGTFDEEAYNEALIVAKKIISNTIQLEKKWFDFDILMECVKSDKKNTGCLNMVLIKDGHPAIERIDNSCLGKS